ncbi:phosphoenolpyruvate carboxylase [Thermodesulfatator atlanticus]|uniref:phosphoenolpyruvate carboxylase n=1 Tax=Thermodesulfatator atlanticus TaxID=501497 RepID=UPI00146D793C|nr:phosphoenolpyruvate carboxylase [Thermodesulfatator atlanticus]
MWREVFNQVVKIQKGPLVPETVCFKPVDEWTDITTLYEDLRLHLKHFRLVTDENPFANPILLLAVNLARRLDKGEVTFSALEQLIQFLDAKAFMVRAERLARYVGTTDPLENLKSLQEFLENLEGLCEKKDFALFAQEVAKEPFGIVITAHPTFALREDLMHLLSDLASGRNVAGVPLSKEQVEDIIKQALWREHLPDPQITLEKEHHLALEAIANIKKALLRFYDLVFKVAQRQFPDKWWEIRPRLITVASWVGYDLDGRRDIDWAKSFAFRLEERKLALNNYRQTLQHIIELLPITSETEDIRGILAQVLQTLEENLAGLDEEISAFQNASQDLEVYFEELRQVAKRMYQGLPRRLTKPSILCAALDAAIEAAKKFPEIQHRLCLLRTEIDVFGLGLSHIHVRLNSKQIHNAMRPLIGLETDPEDPSVKKTYLKALDQLLAGVSPVSINFGSLIRERTTAKRLFMLVAQMVKYIDSETPIRFLIAETESSFTSIAALYFAKLFKVEEHVDLSPLLETTRALVRGARIVDEMLANYHYKNYVLLRGRLCVQTGFSDAGRHLGQPAAGFAIENFRRRLAKVIEKHKLSDVELVIFNTHGESIGRGAHPANFTSRLAYIMPPKSRVELSQKVAALKEEFSFQGGDGYLYFLNPYLALSVLARIFEFARETFAPEDPFYQEWDYVFEFFTTVQQFNERIMQDPVYASLLNDYGRNFIFPTGSRALKRQFEVEKTLLTAAEIRAIPHNAILHQLGLLANTIGGMGQAVRRNPDQFIRFQQKSWRFRQLVSMAEYALSLSDFYAFAGYLHLLDPEFWLMLAAKASNPLQAQELRRVADSLEPLDRHAGFSRIGRLFYRDLLNFAEVLGAIHAVKKRADSIIYEREGLWMDEEIRDDLEILHALRQAIIYQIFTLAVQIPEFSPQRGTTREEIIERILHLDVESAVKVLKQIFPLLEPGALSDDFGEKATYQTEDQLGYWQEHQNIFNPLESLYRLVKRITGGVTHIIGAFG